MEYVLVANTEFKGTLPEGVIRPQEKEHDIFIVEQAVSKFGLCKGLKPDYVTNSIKTCDFLIYAQEAQSDAVHGFVTVKDKATTTIYVEVLCGSPTVAGVGTKLLEFVEEIGKSMGKTTIELDAGVGVVSFYNNRGFTCAGDESLCKLQRSIRKGGKRRGSRGRTFRRKALRRNKKNGHRPTRKSQNRRNRRLGDGRHSHIEF